MDSILKPGFKSTEFAIVVFMAVLGVLATLTGFLDAKWAAVAMSAINAAYFIGRSLVKAAQVQIPPEMLQPPK